jgi:hypothetical protein
MNKIKSARELAMERTAKLKENSGGDTRSAEGEQYRKAAVVLARALLQGKSDLGRVLESIDRYPAEFTQQARRAFLQSLIGEMTLENYALTLEAYPIIYPERKESREVELLRDFHNRYLDSSAAERRAMDGAMKEKDGEKWRAYLRERGIRGSAVAGFNMERFPGWQVKQAETAAAFGAELDRLKADLEADF